VNTIEPSEAVWAVASFTAQGRRFDAGTRYRRSDELVRKYAGNFEIRVPFAEWLEQQASEEVK
jgi:hypothetical protein